MPVQILNGGKSYPDQVAFQRGPQVLAFDDSLNSEFLKKHPFESAQKLHVEKPEVISNVDLLPKQWIGEQAYSVGVIDEKKNREKQHLILVPFADASQTGGAVKVWMPLRIATN